MEMDIGGNMLIFQTRWSHILYLSAVFYSGDASNYKEELFLATGLKVKGILCIQIDFGVQT